MEGFGIYSYQSMNNKIIITFTTGESYEYTYDSAGSLHIEKMKSLAKAGKGLNSYINKYVKYKYSRKL